MRLALYIIGGAILLPLAVGTAIALVALAVVAAHRAGLPTEAVIPLVIATVGGGLIGALVCPRKR